MVYFREALECIYVLLCITKLLNGPLRFIFKEIPDEKSRHLDYRDLQFFYCLSSSKYAIFLCYLPCEYYPVSCKIVLFVCKKWKFYHLHGREINFNMPSLVPFFRLLDVILYAHVSVQSEVNGGCGLCGKKDFPDEEIMFSKTITRQIKD